MTENVVEVSEVLGRVRLIGTPWTAARQAPLSMGFSRQEYRSGFPGPSPGDLPNPRIKPMSLMSNLHRQVGSLPGKRAGIIES